MNLLKIHTVATWMAYAIGALVSVYVSIVGIDHVFAIAVVFVFGLHETWMLHVVATLEKRGGTFRGDLKTTLTLTMLVLLSMGAITLCMLGLFVDVLANGQEGLNVEAYISILTPGVVLFFVASYVFAKRLSSMGLAADAGKSRPTWLLWFSNVYFLIGVGVLSRQIRLIRESGTSEA